MSEFKPGDYVEVVDSTLPKGFCGKAAKVIGAFDGSYLVEFLESHPKLHNGFPSRPGDLKGKKNHCWWCSPEEFSPLAPSCTITVNGDTTYCKRADRKKINGTATCSQHDGQDFLTGAIIALARAYDTDPTTAAYRVLKAFSKVPETEEDDGDPSGLRLVSGYSGEPYGIPGKPTAYKDVNGTPLFVGDTVLVKHKNARRWNRNPHIVVENQGDGQFVMGICAACDPKTGSTGDWLVKWNQSWKELAAGQRYNGAIKVIEAPTIPAPKPKKKRLVFRGGPDKGFYGELGIITDLVDSFGTPLHVGDVVSVLHRNRGYISDDPVVECVVDQPFVMGLAGQRFTKDRRNPDWQIVKARSYTDLLIGEKFSDGWLEVKEEEIDE